MDSKSTESSSKTAEEEQRIDYSALNQPEPMGGSQRPTSSPGSLPPTPKTTTPMSPPSADLEPPHRPIVPFLLMIFLALIVVAAFLVFFSWKGWIKIGQNFWQKTPAPTASPTLTISPSVSTENSPEIIANINDQARKSDLENIRDALKRYFVDKGKYPESETIVKTSDSESVLSKALVPTYLEKLPEDPLTPQYYYGYKSDGDFFELTCILEDKTDPDGTQIGNYYIYKITSINEEER